jgi:polyisoprenoid-binding protein YceI
MKSLKSIKATLQPVVWIVFILGLSSFLESPPSTKYKVDTNASTIVWTGRKITGSHTGNVRVASGEISTEGKSIKQGKFDIDLSSISVTDIKDASSNQKLVTHLKSEDFFAVDKFPKATFIVDQITAASGGNYNVKGKLTIKGITQDIEFPAVVTFDEKKLVANAKVIVDRTKFNIRYGSKTFFDDLGDKAIENNFELDLKLVAVANGGI